MVSKLEMVSVAHTLKDVIDEHAVKYYHSRPLIKQKTALMLADQKAKHPFTLTYGIKDLMLIGALTQSSVLMTGATAVGKTALARLTMNSLFGKEDEGWHRIDINLDFGKDAYTDMDYGILVDGKKTSQGLYQAAPYLFFPGLITDEINRTHAKLVTQLMHIFDKDISLPDGKRVKIGYEYSNGRRYQFQISAINEGQDYSGTFEIDKALRRRTVIEIPMDVFPLNSHDRNDLKKEGEKEILFNNSKNHIDDLIKVYSNLDQIKLHQNAALFLSYLESFDYCEHAINKSKAGVTSTGGSIYHVCTKPVQGTDTICHLIKSFENELCPYIRAITPGISKDLISVAKGAAMMRAVKFAELLHTYAHRTPENQSLPFKLSNPEKFEDSLQKYTGEKLKGNDLARAAFQKYTSELAVNVEDIDAVFGFVGYSKIGLSPMWVAKHYQGNTFEGVQSFIRQAKDKFEEGIAQHLNMIDVSGFIENGIGADFQWKSVEDYCRRENPWLLEALQPFISPSQRGVIRKNELDYLY